jgi:hypothetical protein
MAMAGMAGQVDQAWIADLVAVVLEGIRSDGVRRAGATARPTRSIRKRSTASGKR